MLAAPICMERKASLQFTPRQSCAGNRGRCSLVRMSGKGSGIVGTTFLPEKDYTMTGSSGQYQRGAVMRRGRARPS